ncbi:MAG: hypothetical protein ACRDJV_11045 [Actinomycetota bacterium]
MNSQPDDIEYEKDVPVDAPDEDDLDLIDEEPRALEPDTSPEATAEAGMSHGDVDLNPDEDVEFEEDESEVAT